VVPSTATEGRELSAETAAGVILVATPVPDAAGEAVGSCDLAGAVVTEPRPLPGDRMGVGAGATGHAPARGGGAGAPAAGT
jgi:hypothetical protein